MPAGSACLKLIIKKYQIDQKKRHYSNCWLIFFKYPNVKKHHRKTEKLFHVEGEKRYN